MKEKIKCYKYEIISAVLIVIAFIVLKCFNHHRFIYTLINENNCEYMITLSSIIVGIYITLITILATATIPIATELIKNNTNNKLSTTIKMGLYTNLILIICLVFVIQYLIGKCLIFMLFLYSILLFMRLIHLMVIMYKCNILDNYEQTNKMRKNQDDLITACKHIDNLLTKNDNNKEA